MKTKRILIFLPLIIIFFLLQSYFWVPTYDQQTKGNPERLIEYIEGSIGDANVLNPILSADTASSQIEGLVFEGLIDYDRELNFRGRLATRWDISEEAYFYINEYAPVPGKGKISARETFEFLRDAWKKKETTDQLLLESFDSIKEISLIPPSEFKRTIQTRDPETNSKKDVIHFEMKAPARIKIQLERVDQDLFDNLAKLLGSEYFSSFPSRKYMSSGPDIREKDLLAYLNEILPAYEHNPVIVFYLRPGVKFHDGHKFDAQDVKFTYDSIMDPKNLSPRIADYEPVKAVEVIDPLKIRVTYKRLYSPAIGTWTMGILPEHLLNKEALSKEAQSTGQDTDTFSMRKSTFNRNPIGCGPFVFRTWKSDQHIKLERFEEYWEGPPNYKHYVYRIVPDILTQEMEFYAGTLDSYAVQPHQVNRLEKDDRFQSFSGTSFGYTYIGYNMRRYPLDDPKVRKALGMAIDLDKIINYVLYGQGERITGPFVKQTDYYNPEIKPLPYDPDGALQLLQQAGWTKNSEGWLEKDGKKLQFTLITNSGNDLRKAVLAIAQDAWKQIGIDVRTDLLEWSVFLQERVDKSDFDALVLGWSMGIEPDLYQIWHSSQTNPHQLNFVGFKNTEADRLIIKIREEYDHQKQVKYCHRLHEIIAEQQPYTFLYVNKWTAILDKRIVIRKTDNEGNIRYEKIMPTITGSYTFDFNKWIKLQHSPSVAVE